MTSIIASEIQSIKDHKYSQQVTKEEMKDLKDEMEALTEREVWLK